MKSKQFHKFKETEIGKIPEDWEVKKINDVKEKIFSGGTPDTRKQEYWDGSIPWLSSGETHNRFIRNTEKKITELGVKNSSTKLVKVRDVIVASAGQGYTRGQTSFCMIDTYINQSIVALRSKKEKIIPLFLFYNLLSRYSELRNISDSHSSRGSLTTKLLADLNIQLPPIKEQEGISNILFTIDSKIELIHQINKNLELIGQTIFKQWFIDFEFPNELGDPYKSSGDEMVYNDEWGKEIPKGWHVECLGNLCKEVTDGSHFSPKEDIEGSKFIGTVKNMDLFDIDPQSCKRISDKDYDKLVRDGCKPEKGNILLSKDGTMGITHVFNGQDNLVLLSSIAILRTSEKLPFSYLYHYLKDAQTQLRLIEGHSSGSALPRIVLKDLKKLPILVPLVESLDKFDPFARGIMELILHNSEISRILSKIRDYLLPKLMSGEIRV